MRQRGFMGFFGPYGYGPELMHGGDFEVGGTGGDFNSGAEIDDGTSDIFDPVIGDPWTNIGVNDGNGDKIEATATVHGGSVAVKMTRTLVADISIRVTITVSPNTLYKLSFWTRGDGTAQGRYSVWDDTNAAYIKAITNTGVTGAVYTQIDPLFTSPAGCVSITCAFRMGSINPAGISYFDDVSLKAVL